MTVVVNYRLLPDLLDVEPRTLRTKRPCADCNNGDPVGAGTEPGQLQSGDMRWLAPGVEGTNTTTRQEGGTRPRQELATSECHQIAARA